MKKFIWILLGVTLLWNCKEDEGETIAPEGVVSEFTDARDSRVYRCVTIGDQTWMAENLAYRLPLGSVDGCFTYLESVVDTGRIEPSFDDFKAAFMEAAAEGRIDVENVPGLFFLMYFDYYSTLEEYFQDIELYLQPYGPSEYELCVELRDGLKPKAIAKAAVTNLAAAESDNGDYSCVNGFLYTYEAAQKVVPEGWRLPTDEDWKKLEAYLGMSDQELDVLDEWRDDGVGRLLKDERAGFNPTYGGAKVYGQFNAYGRYPELYYYINKGNNAYYWSSSTLQQNDSTQVAIIRSLSQWDDRILRGTSNLNVAYSIRCIKK